MSLFPVPSSFLQPLHPFGPHILVPHSLLVPLPLTSLFPIPLSSLCPSHPCSLFPHHQLLAPVIHPTSSGSQGWGQVLGCSLCGIVVMWSWSHPCHSSSCYPPYEQWLTAVAWVGVGVLSGCCLVTAELETKKTKENISYLKKRREHKK